MNVEIEIPEPMLFTVTDKARYKIVYGGRGSGKSQGFCRAAIVKAMSSRCRILCTRAYQNSIADSVYKVLVDIIYEKGLDSYFNITQNTITSFTGSEFIFKGLQKITEIKSLEGIDICYVEEATKIPKNTCEVLFPTIRNEGSEIWIGFNPDLDDDYIYKDFVLNQKRKDCIVRFINYADNPFFPKVLKEEMEYDKQWHTESYNNVWLGETRKNTEAQIFRNKYEVKEFNTPDLKNVYQSRFFYGADWGFANDPTTLIRSFIQDNCLYVDYEAYKIGCELEDTPALFRQIPFTDKWIIKADCARPETISFISRRGFNISAAPKWQGSVEDGIEYMRSFKKIYIHPRCVKTAEEFKFYSYKTDRNTDEVLPVIVDNYNHCIDAIRYSISDYIQNGLYPIEYKSTGKSISSGRMSNY